ncbi:6,7-dimethyl-8-ribityllumazine synthase [Yoonia sp. 208BN28-4]|uniref:6,7-dimethyl-8-ribityllumazine synthase n=1 Tax=Yoonia sp. 208BN28-4 TaxID=3126505 RepID=UPI0030AFB95C
MTPPRFAFLKARWHADIVDQALAGFQEVAPVADNFDVPGAFELPLLAQRLAHNYDAVICAALVVDGGIYRHDFVAQSVVQGLMTVGLSTGKPVLSVVLTPHHFQETDHHISVYTDHFRTKGREAAEAALAITQTHAAL